jgi:alginate O-acetyltransferase complex protein AlgI
MLFSSMIFLWLFLPFVLVINLMLPIRLSNLFLLAMSFIFYAWGEQEYIWLLLLSLTVNYAGAMGMEAMRGRGKEAAVTPNRLLLVLLVAVNLVFLGYFKYFDFLAGLANKLAGGTVAEPRNLLLPVGISFYTFQMISYVADVYRGTIAAEPNPLNLGLYISFFPKMIQGPIERYQGMGACIRDRHVTPELFACGARRFIYGLSKKLILANQFGGVVDKVLANPMDQISGGLGWYVGILYTLQIYFDFSGYSDMAVGLGKMLGFELTENFNYPYLAKTVGEFWRRWHISLSGWFKDYLYIPLGGSRKGTLATCRNLMIVFLCTGFWHGAGLSFIAWGLYYGCLQVAERLFLKRRLAACRRQLCLYVPGHCGGLDHVPGGFTDQGHYPAQADVSSAPGYL